MQKGNEPRPLLPSPHSTGLRAAPPIDNRRYRGSQCQREVRLPTFSRLVFSFSFPPLAAGRSLPPREMRPLAPKEIRPACQHKEAPRRASDSGFEKPFHAANDPGLCFLSFILAAPLLTGDDDWRTHPGRAPTRGLTKGSSGEA